MKYCQYCGTELNDSAIFCSRCGKDASPASPQTNTYRRTGNLSRKQQKLINQLSARLKINGIVWIGVASLQILAGVFGAWFTLFVGALNMWSAITDIKNSKQILSNPYGIVAAYEPLTNPIIILIYNLLIGGVIGVIGSIYYLVFVRGFVMKHKQEFLAIERNETDEEEHTNTNSQNHAQNTVYITAQEARIGVQKDVFIHEAQRTLKVKIPGSIRDGSTLVLRNVRVNANNGQTVQRDVHVRVYIRN